MCFPIKDRVEKEWTYAGLQCVVTRADLSPRETRMKHRCGYVRIPPGHSWHGKGCEEIDANVHGGLTFAEIEPCEHADGIGFWIGFDCAHAGDACVPEGETPMVGGAPFLRMVQGHYWTLQEVQEETERLADQVRAAA